MGLMLESRTVNLTLDFCLRVGEVLLSSGAGAADVTATMSNLAHQLGLRRPDIDITFTSLSMTYQTNPEEPIAFASRQVKQRDIDYADLTQVDHLVRAVIGQQVDLEEARASLARIVSSGHARPRWAVTLGWGGMCAGVALQLGGGAYVVAVAFVAAVAIDRLQMWMGRRRVPLFYRQVAGGGVAMLLAAAAAATGLVPNPSLAVTANIVMLLAGIGFVGALQDALSGFYITAGARLTEALLATAGIIAGVSGGLNLAAVAGIQVGRLEPGAADWESVSMLALGAAVCAGSFAYSSYAPGRSVLPIAGVAALAMVISRSVVLQGVGGSWATGVAAFVVGLVSYSIASRAKIPPLVVVVSAVVPMLPGLSIYRSLSLLGEGGGSSAEGLLAMFGAASIAIAVASGVILGEYVAQPIQREAHRLETRLVGPRLVGPLRVRSRRRRRQAEET